jgi:tetratricopeptide (TPR) repeat protein
MPVANLQQPVPDTAENHFAAARSLERQGRLADAAQEWVAGLQIDPRSESAYLSLADALLELKLFNPAVIACQQALMIAPKSAGAHDRLGRAREGAGDRAGAIVHYTDSLKLRPGDAAITHRLATALRADGRLESARSLLQAFCDVHPRDYGSRFLLAGILSDLGLDDQATRQLRTAISHQPKFPEALNNLAVLLRAAGQSQEAEVHLRKAVAQRPEYAAAWNNLGNLYVELSRLEEAIRCYGKALSIQPDYAEAHTNRALISLLQGSFESGWQEYEWRWKQPGVGVRTLPRPEWDGGDLAGKTILLHAEQGAGDSIQFIRYARLLHERGAKILLHCQEPLRTLLEGMPELTSVFSGSIAAPEFDMHAPLMSLPRLFATRIDSIPAQVPYLRPPANSMVPNELDSCTQLRVGLVWRGNPGHKNDRNRSLSLDLLAELVGTEGAQFFSLQVGPSPVEKEWLRAKAIHDLAPSLTDYAATAACLEKMDLLITVDTSVAHLAGALARPVWMLLPPCNDWRWLQKREDSPWYPSMKLLRQEKLRNWPPLIRRVASDLQHEVEKKENSVKEL